MVTDFDYSRPFNVLIVEDCRKFYGPAGCLTGVKGVCLGLYEAPDNLRIPDLSKRAEDPETARMVNAETIDKICSDIVSDDEEVSLFNPLILTLFGEYIWGMECYFTIDNNG